MQNFIAILGAGMSLLCFSICLYCSRYIFATDDCFSQKDNIVEITVQGKDGKMWSGTTAGDLSAYLSEQGIRDAVFCSVAYPGRRSFEVEVSEEKSLPYDLEVMEVDSTYHTVFTPEVIAGNWSQAASIQNSIILSESQAVRIFGTVGDAIGKRMVLTHRLYSSPKSTPRDGGIAYTIQAVMKDLPMNTSLNFLKTIDACVLNDSEGLIENRLKFVTGGWTYALPLYGQSADEYIAGFNNRNLGYEMFNEKNLLCCRHFGEGFWEDSPALYFGNTTLVAGVLVLLVGMLNFFHFLTGTFLTRIREYQIRKVNGAGRWQLFLMLFTQMSLSVWLAALVAFLMIELLAPYLHLTLVSFSIFIDVNVLMWQLLTYLLVLWVVGTMICGWILYKVSRIQIQAGLFGTVGRYGRHRVRNALLAIQLFIGWIFLSLATVLYLQSNHTGNLLFGTLSVEEKEHILSIPLNYTGLSRIQKQDFLSELARCPGVEEVLPAEGDYLQGTRVTGVRVNKEQTDNWMEVNVERVAPGFFRMFHLDILAGRMSQTGAELVIDEVLQKRLKEDCLGKQLYGFQSGYTVTGVCEVCVSNVYNKGREGCMFILSDFSDNVGHCYVKCHSGQTETVAAYIRKLLQELLPESQDGKVKTLMEDIYEMQSIEFKLRGIVLFMAGVILLISILGIYSAVTLDTEYRRKEMAIRKINGAGVSQIVILFARLYAILLLVSALIAFPLVDLLLRNFSRLYASFVETGICFYGSIFLSVLLLVVLTVYVRIRNVARVNPAEVIKRE